MQMFPGSCVHHQESASQAHSASGCQSRTSTSSCYPRFCKLSVPHVQRDWLYTLDHTGRGQGSESDLPSGCVCLCARCNCQFPLKGVARLELAEVLHNSTKIGLFGMAGQCRQSRLLLCQHIRPSAHGIDIPARQISMSAIICCLSLRLPFFLLKNGLYFANSANATCFTIWVRLGRAGGTLTHKRNGLLCFEPGC